MLASWPRISRSSLPVSRVSISASASASRATMSPSRRMSRARPNPVSLPHGPDSARRAAATARSASSAEVEDHIKIAHHPLLVPPADGGEYAGAYWAGTKLVVAEDLGPDQDGAVTEFRELLHERGEA